MSVPSKIYFGICIVTVQTEGNAFWFKRHFLLSVLSRYIYRNKLISTKREIKNTQIITHSHFMVGSEKCGSILHRFRDSATYWLKVANFSYPTHILRPQSMWTLSNLWINLLFAILESLSCQHARLRDRSLPHFHTVPARDGHPDSS